MNTDATIGARIRELRERAGLQSQELAAALGIDPSAISNIEKGKRAVKTTELAVIASTIGVSPLAILSPESPVSQLPVAARATDSEGSVGTVVARLNALTDLHHLLLDSGCELANGSSLDEVPEVDIEHWLASADRLAQWARESLLPPSDGAQPDRFTKLAEAIERNLGVDVMVEGFPAREVLGACITDRRWPFILVNRGQPITRALFTLAHELGHVLSGEGKESITLDVTLTQHTKEEMFANAFAASFLMPSSSVQELIDKFGVTSKALASMVSLFGVSFESLIYRLHNLGKISAATRDQLQSLGWPAVLQDLGTEDRRRALARQGMQPERRPPGLLTVRTHAAYEAGIVSVRPLASLLDVNPDELIDLYVRERDSQEAWSGNVTNETGVDPSSSDEDRYSGVPA